MPSVPRNPNVVAAFVGVVAFVSRAGASWRLPLQDDEASSLMERSLRLLMIDDERFFNPPVWRAMTVGIANWTDDLWLQRLPSCVLAALGCAWVARRAGALGGRHCGLFAGLGLALSPWLVRQQGQLRSYGLAMLAACVVAVALLDLARTPTRKSAVLAGVAVGLAGWAHFALLSWLPVAGLALVWLFVRDRLRLRTAAVALAVAGLLSVGPVWLAVQGLKLKSGGPSASMMPWSELWWTWHPELLAVAVGVTAAVFGRLRGANLALFFAAVGLSALWLGAAGWLQTVRWGHLVVTVPALWLAVASALGSASARAAPSRGSNGFETALSLAIVVLLAVVPVWKLSDALEEGASRQDDAVLAQWIRAQPGGGYRTVAAHEVERGGDTTVSGTVPQTKPRGRAVAHALGYFRGGPSRCVGPDVVHEPRCRQQVRVWKSHKAVCLANVCTLPVPDAPTPVAAAKLQGPIWRADLFGVCSAGANCSQVGRWAVTQTRADSIAR